MTLKKRIFIGLLTLLALLMLGLFFFYRSVTAPPEIKEVPNPITNRAAKNWKAEEEKIPVNPMKNLYFGDLHVHTRLSMDAYLTGNHTSPDDAYNFARGEPVEVVGNKIQLKQPLDFTAITDHSEFLGEIYTFQNESAANHNKILPKYVRYLKSKIKEREFVGERFRNVLAIVKEQHSPIFEGFETTKSNWSVLLEAAERHYEPGKFTTFAGYEWTYGLIAHRHRNVIFRDMMVPDYPISSFEASSEEAFWQTLQQFTNNGATVLAIPHNSNLSRGKMFTSEMPDGNPITREYAQLRQKFEKLVEVHQNKGNSEVYADFWKNDEFADFENYYEGALTRNSFVRDALKEGLKHEENLGVNPFKYGMIGSTDTHNSTPGNTEEDKGTPGQFGYSDASAKIRSTEGWAISGDRPPAKIYTAVNPGGLVAVWAEANTRGHIYDALARKEVYATSGNRIKVRFFGSFDFEKNYGNYDTLVTVGYTKGVPMGGDLINPQMMTNQFPRFLIWAAKDPEGANLERIQVVKGWYEDGQLKEKIFDAIIAPNAKNATVDSETGQWDRSKGTSGLGKIWADPDFDPAYRAFYYLRVLEVPTARWNLWDEIKYGVKYPDTVPKTVRERAWSSPIWYVPDR